MFCKFFFPDIEPIHCFSNLGVLAATALGVFLLVNPRIAIDAEVCQVHIRHAALKAVRRFVHTRVGIPCFHGKDSGWWQSSELVWCPLGREFASSLANARSGVVKHSRNALASPVKRLVDAVLLAI